MVTSFFFDQSSIVFLGHGSGISSTILGILFLLIFLQKLIQAGFTITDRRYIGREDDTNYHHVALDVCKNYEVDSEYEIQEE